MYIPNCNDIAHNKTMYLKYVGLKVNCNNLSSYIVISYTIHKMHLTIYYHELGLSLKLCLYSNFDGKIISKGSKPFSDECTDSRK